MKLPTVLFAVLTVFFACDDAEPEVALTASAYCEETADFFCDFYLRCGRMNVANKQECLSAFAESCEGRWEPRYRDLETGGLLELSREGIESCRAHLAAVACEAQVRDLAGPCQEMWVGKQPVAGPCSYDLEAFVCEPTTECVLDLTFCGQCEPVALPGEACGEDVGCGTRGFCRDGLCVAVKKIGEACGVGDACEVSASCVDGVCLGPVFVRVGETCNQARRCPYLSSCVAGTCQATERVSGACVDDSQCATGFCEAGACVPLLAAGAGCTRAAQCSTGRCDGAICENFPGQCF